jgi:hypothetical protein
MGRTEAESCVGYTEEVMNRVRSVDLKLDRTPKAAVARPRHWERRWYRERLDSDLCNRRSAHQSRDTEHCKTPIRLYPIESARKENSRASLQFSSRYIL